MPTAPRPTARSLRTTLALHELTGLPLSTDLQAATLHPRAPADIQRAALTLLLQRGSAEHPHDPTGRLMHVIDTVLPRDRMRSRALMQALLSALLATLTHAPAVLRAPGASLSVQGGSDAFSTDVAGIELRDDRKVTGVRYRKVTCVWKKTPSGRPSGPLS